MLTTASEGSRFTGYAGSKQGGRRAAERIPAGRPLPFLGLRRRSDGAGFSAFPLDLPSREGSVENLGGDGGDRGSALAGGQPKAVVDIVREL